jgi:hypothetical protein
MKARITYAVAEAAPKLFGLGLHSLLLPARWRVQRVDQQAHSDCDHDPGEQSRCKEAHEPLMPCAA